MKKAKMKLFKVYIAALLLLCMVTAGILSAFTLSNKAYADEVVVTSSERSSVQYYHFYTVSGYPITVDYEYYVYDYYDDEDHSYWQSESKSLNSVKEFISLSEDDWNIKTVKKDGIEVEYIVLTEEKYFVFELGFGFALDGENQDIYNLGVSAGYETGVNDGIDQGFEQGYESGLSSGILKGMQANSQGVYNAGKEEGYTEGYNQCLADNGNGAKSLNLNKTFLVISAVCFVFGFCCFVALIVVKRRG